MLEVGAGGRASPTRVASLPLRFFGPNSGIGERGVQDERTFLCPLHGFGRGGVEMVCLLLSVVSSAKRTVRRGGMGVYGSEALL